METEMATPISNGSLHALEQKYIELLERRVADLERRLSPAATAADGLLIYAYTSILRRVKDKPSTLVATETKANNEHKTSSTDDDKDKKSGKDDEKKKEEEEDDDEDKTRHRIVLNSLDQETGEYVDRPPAAAPKSTSVATRAFTFRKFMRTQIVRGEEAMTPRASEVDVESEPLQRLLGRITQKYTLAVKVTLMESPYQSLIWTWDAAQQEANKVDSKDSPDDKQAREDLKALLDIISTSSGDEMLDRYFKTKKAAMSDDGAAMVPFESLWTLFPKGSFVLARPFLRQPQVFLVQTCRMPDMNDSNPVLTVLAYCYDWDGSTFNRVPFALNVESYPDRKSMFELPFYPLHQHRNLSASAKTSSGPKDVEELTRTLIERGREFRRYCIAGKGKQTFRYDGEAVVQQGGLFRSDSNNEDDGASFTSDRDEDTSQSRETASTLRGVVVVDFRSYFQYQSAFSPRLGELRRFDGLMECSCMPCREAFEDVYHYSWDKTGPQQELTPDQYMMFPPRVLGYSLGQKRWVQLLVSKLKDPRDADRAKFDSKLILSKESKDIIRKSVQAHGKANVVDYIPGKGKGLVILLWGVPGVGKTLTAESVAALAGKPLFTISVADIGIESSKVEANLEKVFALAGLWEAVLLFDEADVFLEARDARGSSLERNTMVSVLLRVLEYYEGILVLTTNRLKTFDLAVQSRIHIAIQFTDLGPDQRQAIFEEFLGQLNAQSLVEEWEKCNEWVREEGRTKMINGRQIRNIVFTAMGLAHAENRGMRRSDLSEVTLNTETFRRAMADQEAIFRNAQIQPTWN